MGAVNLAELYGMLILAPEVRLPLALIRFIRFSEAKDAHGSAGNGLSGRLGLFLRHLIEVLVRNCKETEALAGVFAPLARYNDVREGMLLVVDGLVRPRAGSGTATASMRERLKAIHEALARPAGQE